MAVSQSLSVTEVANSQSVANNTSKVRIVWTSTQSGESYNGYTRTAYFYVSVNGGAETKYSVSYTLPKGTTKTILDKTITVTHEDDGSGTVKVRTWMDTDISAGVVEKSKSITLEIIPRASEPTLSDNSVTMLNTVKITTNRKSTAFTHDLTYKFNGHTGTIATGVGASYTWTVPDLVSKISGKKSGTCTIYCKTKKGSTVVGTKSITLTLNIPAKSTPSAKEETVQMGTSVDIYTNRKSSGYTHKITYEIGGKSGTIGSNVTSKKSWTPPKTLANYTSKKTSATCTITCETYNGTLLVGTATTQIILKVPSATKPTLSKSSIVLGDSLVILTPREVDCYEHDISYTLKAKNSSTVAFSKNFSSAIQAAYEWTPSLPLLAPAIPSATEGTITLTCKTRFKDSTTIVGEETVSLAITVPNNDTTKPKLTMSLTPVHTLASAFDEVYVQGKSKVKVSYEASSDYSSIASYETKILGMTSKLNPFTSSILSNEGTVKIVGKVTDARGYFTEITEEIEVIPYSRPRIIPGESQNAIVCVRGNSNGSMDAGGVRLLIKAGRKYYKVVSNGNQKNYCKLSYSYKTDAQGDDEYSIPVELLAKDATTDYVSVNLPNIVSSNLTAYNIKLIAEDDVGENDTVTILVPTAFATWHSPPGGHGFTVGGYHDPSKHDVFDCLFDAEFEGNVSGKVLGLGCLPEIPEDADFNDYKDFGAYAVAKNATAKTILNCPSEKAGTLRVWSANGKGNAVGSYVYIMQEYIAYDNSATYRRSIQLPAPESAWEYKEWKTIDGIDSIISQGLTDGWYWRKYANGTAECWRRVKNEKKDITTPFGSMFYANCDEVDFPFSFYSAPVVIATVESGTALSLLSWQGTDANGTTTASKPASYRVIRPTQISGASFTIAYHAIGRWKE